MYLKHGVGAWVCLKQGVWCVYAKSRMLVRRCAQNRVFGACVLKAGCWCVGVPKTGCWCVGVLNLGC